MTAGDKGQGPRVSIGLPVYQGADFLAEALESILGQDFGDFELIVADNASTDGTPDIIEAHARADRRIRWVRHPRNLGAARNYNYVFHAARAPYFKWAAHDDLMEPGFLSACLRAFETRGDAPVLVYPNSDYVDADRQPVETGSRHVHTTAATPAARLSETLAGLGLVTSVFGLFRRDALARTRLIGHFVSSDYALLAECALLGPIVRLEGPVLFHRRLHEGISRRANRTNAEIMRWFDPEARPDACPWARLEREYMASVRGIEGLTRRQRLAAALVLLRRRTRRKGP